MQNFLKTYFKGDSVIWALYAFFVVVSLVVMYSASSQFFLKKGIHDHFSPLLSHATFLGMGAVLLYVVYRLVPFRLFDKYAVLIYAVSLALLIYSTFRGSSLNGANRWFSILGVQFQPSELAKFGVVLLLAKVLTQFQNLKDKTPDDGIWRYLAIWFVPAFFILMENFSTFLLLTLVCASMIFFARISKKMVLRMVGATVAFMLFLFTVVYIHSSMSRSSDTVNGVAVEHVEKSVESKSSVGAVVDRILRRGDTWMNRLFNHSEVALDESFKITDKNYQTSHARIAVANGWWHGLGPGNSIERDFLPMAFSDFVFSIIVEEYGIFSWLVIIAYLVLLYRVGLLVCNQCRSIMQSLVVLGVACLIGYQAFVNISVGVGLIPVTGQPLPFISRGGTSILMTSLYFGIILSISRQYEELAESEKKDKMKKSKTPTVAEEAEKETPAMVEIPSADMPA